MQNWRRSIKTALTGRESFDPDRGLSEKAKAQKQLLKQMLDTMLTPEIKITASPLIGPLLRNITPEQLHGIRLTISAIAGSFDKLDEQYPDA